MQKCKSSALLPKEMLNSDALTSIPQQVAGTGKLIVLCRFTCSTDLQTVQDVAGFTCKQSVQTIFEVYFIN